MVLRSYTAILIFVSITNLYSQISPGARQISLANSDAALSNDVFAIFNNPAGLAQINWRELGVYYSPAPFGLKELANGYGAYIEPASFGNMAAGFMTYGFELYRENKFLLSFSKALDKNLFIGASAVYHSLTIAHYGSDNALSFNLGGLAYLHNNLRWGFSYNNFLRATYGNEDDQIPSYLTTGFSLDAADEIILNAAVEKYFRSPLSLRFGVEYNLIDIVYLRTGFSTEPDRFCAGIGFAYSYFELDYSIFNHTDLGLTHQAGLIISFHELGNTNKKIKEHLGF